MLKLPNTENREDEMTRKCSLSSHGLFYHERCSVRLLIAIPAAKSGCLQQHRAAPFYPLKTVWKNLLRDISDA